MIIDDHCTMIGWIDTIRLQEYGIINLVRVEFYTTTDKVIKNKNFIFWCFESNSEFFSTCHTFTSLLKRKMPTVSIISSWKLEFFLFLSEICESFACTKTIIGTSFFTEFMEFFLINRSSFTLGIWSISTIMVWSFIRTHSYGCESLDNLINSIFYETSTISILNPDNKFPIIMPSPKIRIKSSTQVTNMDVSSWGWSKACTN